jgi:hypothetical protein
MSLAKCQIAQLDGKQRLQIVNTCNVMTNKNVNEINLKKTQMISKEKKMNKH